MFKSQERTLTMLSTPPHLSISARQEGLDCLIQLDESGSWPSQPPIITDAEDELVLPAGSWEENDRTITVAVGEEIKLACAGNAFAESALAGSEYATAM